jgi:hypothetical protein
VQSRAWPAYIIAKSRRRTLKTLKQPNEDRLYFEARAEHELALARSAPHPEAARAHSMLAGLYLDRLCAEMDSFPSEGARG